MSDPTRDHLRLLAKIQQFPKWGGLRPGQWLLDNGREFRPGPLPKGVRRGAKKGCWTNSLRLAIRGGGRWVYCEGMATSMILAEHAWCYDRETGLVVDVTWEDGGAYWGVPIRTDYACSRRHLPALWDTWNGYPIMTGAVAESEWREKLP
jgi:hypothetical protein